MDGEARILQQGVQVPPVEWRRELSRKRIGGEEYKEQKTHADEPHHAEHPGNHGIRHTAAESGNGARPDGKDQGPQQQ